MNEPWQPRAMFVLLAIGTCALVYDVVTGTARVLRNKDLTCPPNYATEYTSSGHKYCRLVLPECKQGERR